MVAFDVEDGQGGRVHHDRCAAGCVDGHSSADGAADGLLQRRDHDGQAEQPQGPEKRQQDDRKLPEMFDKPSAPWAGEIQPSEVVKDEYAVDGQECDIDRLGDAAFRVHQYPNGIEAEKGECDNREWPVCPAVIVVKSG